jgi:hypothetical protein
VTADQQAVGRNPNQQSVEDNNNSWPAARQGFISSSPASSGRGAEHTEGTVMNEPTVTITIDANPTMAQTLRRLGLPLTPVRPANGHQPAYAVTISPEQVAFLGELADVLLDLRFRHLEAVQTLRGGFMQLAFFPEE